MKPTAFRILIGFLALALAATSYASIPDPKISNQCDAEGLRWEKKVPLDANLVSHQLFSCERKEGSNQFEKRLIFDRLIRDLTAGAPHVDTVISVN